jgi:D-glycero-D-manno-heptose 1,7-bisphosphate phosphatase
VPNQPAIFLDRDGVLIQDIHLLTRREQVRIFSYASSAVQRLKDAGFFVVVVTNQTVIARGLASECDIEYLHNWIQEKLVADGGSGIDKFYYCPHHPNATVLRYRHICECRKPSPGMIFQAAQELDIDLERSWLVGDRISDIVAGQNAGCKTILVETGMHEAPAIESSYSGKFPGKPDFVCDDLRVATDIILGGKV